MKKLDKTDFIPVETLLIPRYKVLADYPHSPYKVGDVITLEGRSVHLTTTSQPSQFDLGERSNCENFVPHEVLDKYPHLFKKMYWFEERKFNEMPSHLEMEDDGKTSVYKVDKWLPNMFGTPFPNGMENGNNFLLIIWRFQSTKSIPLIRKNNL